MSESIRVRAEGNHRRSNFLRSRISELTNKVKDSRNCLSDERVTFLEKTLSRKWNSQVLATNSASSALQLSLLASGVTSGDEVILSAFAPLTTAYAVTAVGAIPVFVDINPQTFTIDVKSVQEVIGAKTKAVIASHSHGLMAQMKSLMRIGSEYNIKVIEDVGCSLGAMYNHQSAGTVGDFGCYAMGSDRSLGKIDDGGAIACQDGELLAKIKHLRDSGKKLSDNCSYIHEKFGFRGKMGELRATIINLELQFLPQWNYRRRQIATRYNYAFAKLPIQIPIASIGYTHAYNQYPILTHSHSDRLILEHRLSNIGIQTEKFTSKLVPDQAVYSMGLSCYTGCLDKARDIIERLIYLPIYPELEDGEVEAVIAAMYNAYQHRDFNIAGQLLGS